MSNASGGDLGGFDYPEIDAADVRRLCLAATAEADPHGLRFSGVRIVGPLDLSAATVPVPLWFTSCEFTDPLRIEGADLHELVITDGRRPGELHGPPGSESHLPGLVADGVRIAHDLVLSGAVITADLYTRASRRRLAAVWLTDAEIGGRLLANGAKITSTGGHALSCSRAHVRGEVRFADGFEAIGAVRLIGARLDSYLDLSGVRLRASDPASTVLDLNEATIGGSVFLIDGVPSGARPIVEGRVEMGRTVIHGQLLIRNADLHPSATESPPTTSLSEQTTGRPALLAPHLVVHGRCAIQGRTVIDGAVVLQGADLHSGVRFDHADLRNPGEIALDLSNAVLGAGFHLAYASVRGSVNLRNARVSGVIDLAASTLTEPRDLRSVWAVSVRADGDVSLTGTTAAGGIDFRSATVAGMVDAAKATIENPGDVTLSLHQAQVQGNVRICLGFRSVGVVVLGHATIGGRLHAGGGTLIWVPGPSSSRALAVDAKAATILGGMDLGWTIENGGVDLTHATTTYLADTPATDWPADTWLGGFRYERFVYAPDAPSRIRWLAAMRPQDPRSWEQAAQVLRQSGDHVGAENVLIAQRRHARQGQHPLRRASDIVQYVTVRYGYRPQRALAILLLLIAVVTVSLTIPGAQATMRATDQNAVVFASTGAVEKGSPSGDCGGGKVRCFNAFFYAVDTVVPIIDLKQRATWYPSPDRGGTLLEWWLNICTILGWVASTIFALSFTRLGRP